MNEASINIFNAIAFPPASVAGRVKGDPFFTQENDPVTSAIAGAFGRIALGLLVALIAVVTLVLIIVQSLSPAPRFGARNPGAQSPPVASATANP